MLAWGSLSAQLAWEVCNERTNNIRLETPRFFIEIPLRFTAQKVDFSLVQLNKQIVMLVIGKILVIFYYRILQKRRDVIHHALFSRALLT